MRVITSRYGPGPGIFGSDWGWLRRSANEVRFLQALQVNLLRATKSSWVILMDIYLVYPPRNNSAAFRMATTASVKARDVYVEDSVLTRPRNHTFSARSSQNCLGAIGHYAAIPHDR